MGWRVGLVVAAAIAVAIACGSGGGGSRDVLPPDAGTDAGVDAGTDAGVDAGTDAGMDAGTDGGTDAGPDGGGYGGKAGCEDEWDRLGDNHAGTDPSIYKSGDADRVVLNGGGINVAHYDIFSGPGIVSSEQAGREKLCSVYRIVWQRGSTVPLG